ncbi:MAG TPA: hypothetical protein VGR37_13995 [Longimicrobiaceae bacterium]|nr:hypothetical protein [Longimicrobiaceae bacterium]
MLSTVRGIVREGRIALLEGVDLPEGTPVLITLLSDEEAEFWAAASGGALDAVWDNTEDDVYGELLQG